MKKSFKKQPPPPAAAANKSKGTSTSGGHLCTLHNRLYHAFNLGTRIYDGSRWKWQWLDIQTQKYVVHSIAAFLDATSGGTRYHPLVKESIADIVGALAWILQHKSEAVTSIAAEVALKLTTVIPNAILQLHILDLVHALTSLLSTREFQVSKSCSTALNMIFQNLSVKHEAKVWKILVETNAVSQIVCSMREGSSTSISVEHFQEMASLLSTILCRWPPSRYPVWTDAKLMGFLNVMLMKPELSVKVAVLNIYSGLALCGDVAMKLLEGVEMLLQVMVICMGKSNPVAIRMGGFKFAQILVTNEQGCSKTMNLFCEPIVKAIIDGMSGWTLQSGKIANDVFSLLVEACRLALIVKWQGEHHNYFWKHRIDKILLRLILENYHDGSSQHSRSLEEQIFKAKEGLATDFLLPVRAYVWYILGWLVIHCSVDFIPSRDDDELPFDILVTCACVSFSESIRKGRQLHQHDAADAFRSESVARAVLMMVYSPCKYISSKVRIVLSEILEPEGTEYLKHVLHTLNVACVALSHQDMIGLPNLFFGVNMVALTCFTGFVQYQGYIVESGGINILLAFVRQYLSRNSDERRPSHASHFFTMFNERTCCWVCEDWEGDDILLFYGLWGLAELLHSIYVGHNNKVLINWTDYSEAQFVSTLKEICAAAGAPGLKWYASYLLCCFGFYGFPSKMGCQIGEALNDNVYTDTQLTLVGGDSVSVHGIILATRCPLLLPLEDSAINQEFSSDSSVRYDSMKPSKKHFKEVRLSSHVDKQALMKLLEFVYSGDVCIGQELVKKLKTLAKHCRLHPLSTMLSRRRPKWGAAFPAFEISSALSSAGHFFSDIILEAKGIESTCWMCSTCSLSMPHFHAHKIILSSSCDYLRAMFQSGMQESGYQTIKLPITWEAMIRLMNWFYTNELPSPPTGCAWNNMSAEEAQKLLQPYLELYWLSELWLLEDVRDICHRVIVSCLDSARHLSIEIIKVSSDFSLWSLAEVAASYLAPMYCQLCHSGDLDSLDESLVDMIRAASVKLSEE